MNLTDAFVMSRLSEIEASSASGRYPDRTQSDSHKAMHKVLQVRGWKASADDSYSHPDLEGHSVKMSAGGAFTYTHPKGSHSGFHVDELKTCMSKMQGAKY